MIIRRAQFDQDKLHRLTLERIWREDRPKVICCGKNPSDADANRDDPTTLWMMRWAEGQGYGALEMVNFDTFVTSSPDQCTNMVRHLLRSGQEVFEFYSARCIETILTAWKEAGDDALFIAAWGVPLYEQRNWYKIAHQTLIDAGIPLHHLGLTNDGFPKHPLARGKHRISNDQQPIRWIS